MVIVSTVGFFFFFFGNVVEVNLDKEGQQDWLANVVMVKTANGKWQMCVDFTDFNKACSK